MTATGTRKRQKGPPPHQGGLTALLDGERAKAAAVSPTDEQLARWLAGQLAALAGHMERLWSAIEANEALMEGPEDPRWERQWMLHARWRYAAEAQALVAARGHVMVCPNHGIAGADDVPAEWFEGLASRGMLADPPAALGWTRYCERCGMAGPIRTLAAELYRNHQEANR